MKKITCIVCPNSCEILVDSNNSVTGNKCPRGKVFALQELTNPMRALSTTVKTSFADIPVVPVKTNKEVSKQLIPDIMNAINSVVIQERLGINEIVIKNVCNTSADVILISNVLKEDK